VRRTELALPGGVVAAASRQLRELHPQVRLECDQLRALRQLERMVELARQRGVDARVGDVQELPFDDGEFDVAIAAWMLYHVPDVPRALAELARVLEPGGRLVAVTNYLDHLREARELIGAPPRTFSAFSGENGEELLRAEFGRVERREASGEIRFPDRESVESYVRATQGLWRLKAELPDFELPFVVRRRTVVFVAEKAPTRRRRPSGGTGRDRASV
jgi:SAM-dependent methyltransferase